jgi:RNA polymerase sigma-70 factor (ECF subfamily)
MHDQQPSEEALLERLRLSRSGEERTALLERILAPYLDRIARWAQRISADPETAAEVAQDALLAICSHVDRFRGECRFSTWIYTIVRNQAWKRGSRTARGLEVPLEEVPEPSSGPEAEGSLERREGVERFRRLIESELTPLEARIFLLHFGEGVPLAVLDRELGLQNRSGSRAYLISAKRKLRRKMRGLRGGPLSAAKLKPTRLAGVGGPGDD